MQLCSAGLLYFEGYSNRDAETLSNVHALVDRVEPVQLTARETLTADVA